METPLPTKNNNTPALKKSIGTGFFIISMLGIFITGLLVLGGLYLFLNQETLKKQEVGISPVTSEPVSLTLNLSSPDENLLVFEPDILIQGKTTPNSIVLLSATDKDIAVDTTPDGNFSLTLKLKQGLNNLNLTVFDPQGNSKSENRTVYYSTEKI
ncbi:hypothetical protein A3A14_03890 [Candidatus Daviesbacteria bacterium RIFCSPLOWO2_01_FULL_43_38]|uniref:Bacterial Ig-like domain-containing protein n=2 Tax=Candidatus Daviesiibacteriota TaxID=1752718 RepID=A0A1F5K2H8_9BACT|nr:MAG: hypothetical protein UV33_C0025G0009 [Candidatus Daviesbacteria bacterium GW2011_GWA1_42_6]OGE20540.1 MAG: hypothetical protein A2874_01620 [Candidatus Daviesbacteria bacterium RIFCSPHIGHO2_01_FULL_43_17]OGE35086.1 MAG: hypothetical protein A3E45_03070 [Candidatus Daviesbacteria bacterium RIFCSPHIGHO2_12_FULL_43_11]OGE63347.1 MAG: hypothetical protein A3A14_03890 [Candidatus Daviesbacteria bacterium RIFCSPLOWO2_01_FULL_43_38]OGE70541.1 MAG: hypothetical protein A3J21_02830 [Candidatus D